MLLGEALPGTLPSPPEDRGKRPGRGEGPMAARAQQAPLRSQRWRGGGGALLGLLSLEL